MAHETTNVNGVKSGTGWTLDVTACNLSTVLSLKDFVPFHNGTLVSTADYTKTTATVLTYTGVALGGGTVVEIHRLTPDGPLAIIGYADRLSSADYNAELDRMHRIINEGRLNGIGSTASIDVTLDNSAYDFGTWSVDIIKGATRQALANKYASVEATVATKAALASPVLTGTPTSPTATAANSTLQIANTAWAQSEFVSKAQDSIITGVLEIQSNSTAVTKAANDNSTKLATTAYCDGNFVDIADTQNITGAKTFTVIPISVTPAVDNNSTQVATTAYYAGQASASAPLMDGSATVGTSIKFSRQDHVHPTDTSRAPLASPALTGTPTSPTAAVDTNTTQVATTAFVVGQAGSANPIMDSSATVGTSLRYSRQDHVHPSDTTKAPLASPALTGTPTAPTAAVDTNTTQLATTAYVVGQASSIVGVNTTTSGAVGTSLRYARADHGHPSCSNTLAAASKAATAVTADVAFSLDEDSDAGNNFAASKYTAPITGVYAVTLNIYSTSAAGLRIVVNNSTNSGNRDVTANTWSSGTWFLQLTASDYLELASDTSATYTVRAIEFVRLS